MEWKCLLIGGRSNAGKSTAAEIIAARIRGAHISTDKLGRHPGRPWGSYPAHVADHYRTKSDEEILAALLVHQRALQPAIVEAVRKHDEYGGQAALVLEGSAIMPNEARSLISDSVRAVWLTMSDEVAARRIRDDSDYGRAGADQRFLIDRFIERNCRLDAYLRREAARLGLPLIVVDDLEPVHVADACLAEVPLR
jgi:2-phosphoglycerate kinase